MRRRNPADGRTFLDHFLVVFSLKRATHSCTPTLEELAERFDTSELELVTDARAVMADELERYRAEGPDHMTGAGEALVARCDAWLARA